MADLIFQVSAFIAIVAIVTAFIRMVKGPSIADRAVALDVMTIISISVISFISCCTNRIIYIDVAAVYALISFLGIIAIARYIEGGL